MCLCHRLIKTFHWLICNIKHLYYFFLSIKSNELYFHLRTLINPRSILQRKVYLSLERKYVKHRFINLRMNKLVYNFQLIFFQGPKQNTLNDFWAMIWQEHVTQIVMLTNLQEETKVRGFHDRRVLFEMLSCNCRQE